MRTFRCQGDVGQRRFGGQAPPTHYAGPVPSFRVQLNILALRPGHPPEAVMDAAVAALATRHHVEANQLDIVAGIPRITLRFTVEEEEHDADARAARSAAALMRAGVEQVAQTKDLVVLRRVRGRWSPV